MKSPVVIITGPTASGKSRLALDMASAHDGVIINADSMQVYRELRVLTARPGRDSTDQVPHRLYGVVSAAERFSVGAWRRQATAELDDVASSDRLPIFCGGSGLYLKALMEGLARVPEIPQKVRAETEALFDRLGAAAFHEHLAEHDPPMAGRLKPGDGQRLRRAWDVFVATGRSLAEWQADELEPPNTRSFCVILVMPPREALNAACDARFDRMMAEGALDEVAALDRLGLDPALPVMKSLGVAELRRYLDGEFDLETAIEAAKRATRQFAKRQVTWFRHQLTPDLTINEQYSESLQPRIFSFIREFLLTEDR